MHGSRVTRAVTLSLLFSLLAITPTFAKEIDSRGTYNGFFQSTQNRGLWGFMTFDIGEVRNHRFTGVVTMLVNDQTALPFTADGTVSTSGEFTGNGSGPGGRVQFHGQIEFIDGGAAIADASYFFMPMGSQPPDPDRGTATLIRVIIVGQENPPPTGDDVGAATVMARYTIFFGDGSVDRGSDESD